MMGSFIVYIIEQISMFYQKVGKCIKIIYNIIM